MAETVWTVASECLALQSMKCDWKVIDALLGGTEEMRKQGEAFLPREPRESQTKYNIRVKRSFLYEMLKDTMRRLRGKPFSRPVGLAKTLTGRLEGFEKNVDGRGSTLTQFASTSFDSGQNRGLLHVLTDYPNVAREGETEEQLRQRITLEAEEKIRPFFVLIKADDLLGFGDHTDPDTGVIRLTMIRFREWITEQDGDWGEKKIEQIRVLRRVVGEGGASGVAWEKHRKNEKGDWFVWAKGTFASWITEIPLDTCYFNPTGFMTAEPPHRALAWLNVEHWCAKSDHGHALRFNSWGLLFSKGFKKDEVKEDGDDGIGPSTWIAAENKDADMKVVESSGSAIGAGRTNLLDIEARGEVLGLQPLMTKSAGQTAQGQAMDDASTQNDVQTWVRALEGTFLRALERAHQWVQQAMEKDQAVDIFSDFGLSLRASTEIEQLIKLRQAREITSITLLREVRKRGVLSEDLDPMEENAAVRNEPPLDGFTGGSGGDPAGGVPVREAA